MYINAISSYRVSNYFYKKKLKVVSKIIDAVTYILFNCSIPGCADIGRATVAGHRGVAVVIHPESKIGARCIIGSGVVLGGKGFDIPGAPKIGNDVYLGAGSKIIGSVVIGDGAFIGANAVVVNDVPANAIAGGIPAKVISYK